MGKCFKRNNVEADATCFYCGKEFCEKCLILQGKRKTIICEDCYDYYLELFTKAKKRRIFYIVAALLIIIPLIFFSYYSFIEESPNSSAFIIVTGAVIFAIIISFLRIKQIKDWLIKENFRTSDLP